MTEAIFSSVVRCVASLTAIWLLQCGILNVSEVQAQLIELNTTSCSNWKFWAPWSEVTVCDTTASCGSGRQTRRRERQCAARTGVTQVDVQTFACGDLSEKSGAPTVGQWTAWTQSNQCAAFCGRGLRKSTRTRPCYNQCGSQRCTEELKSEKFLPCVNQPCDGICASSKQSGVTISPYSPAPGYFLQCMKGSGFLRQCPPAKAFPNNQTRMAFGIQEIFRVCHQNLFARFFQGFFAS